MNVVLIYPRTGFDVIGESVDPPMSVLCAATLIEKQYKVTIIDQRVDPNWPTTLEEALDSDTVCVGISCMTGPQIRHALDAASLVRMLSDVPIVFGGVHPTLLPEQTLAHPLVDYVVVGEGELAFQYLVDTLARGESTKRIVMTTKYVDLDTLPSPPYHLLDMEKYIGSQGRFREEMRALIFFASRGCPYRCGYCCNEELHHGRLRRMSAEQIYERSRQLVHEYKLDAIMYHDEDFFIDKKRVEKLADLINGEWRWWAQVRMDSALNVDLWKLRVAGLINVQAGIESGSPRMLEYIQKGEELNDMRAANYRFCFAKIKPLYNFMIGFPTETQQELMETVDFADRLLRENLEAEMTGTYIYVPYPGTKLYMDAVRLGFQPPNSLEGWASFTRQRVPLPWLKPHHHAILTMSKFLDGTRMLRRMKGGVLLRLLIKWYQLCWRRHWFWGTGWLSSRLFKW